MRILVICCLLVMNWHCLVFAAEGNDRLPEGTQLLGEAIVRSDSFKNDKKAMRSIDAMIPALKRVGKGRVVRIEGTYAPSLTKEEKVQKSLNLAKEVEQYIRKKHNLPLDLYIAIQDDIVEKRSHKSVRILVYQTQFSEASL